MKKTLLALAALAATSASFAQSSVTLYGVLDASLESVKGTNTTTKVTSGNLATSRLGFKGTEDIGGGLKANFALEGAVSVDTGAAASTFWDRQAWVGLAGGFGELRLGRTDSSIGDIAGNVLSAQAYDDLKMATRAGNEYRRANNAITYILPTLVPGLSAQLQYSTGAGTATTTQAAGTTPAGEAAGSSEGKTYGLNVKYVAGPLSAGVGYLNAKDETINATVKDKANATLVYAGYDFGVAKVTGYYDAETSFVGGKRKTVLGAKVAVPVAPNFTVITGLSTLRNINGDTDGDDNAQVTTIKAIYDLSKRTAVYGMLTNVNNGDATDLGSNFVTTADKKTNRGIAVGVRHAF
ncbi:MAG: porin [Aquabacterium sp.]|uniref:porin n=1 Tax=Aquabacterium sp. TaxID=1872578 RepID=UPI0025C22848|nr:porin [Aquabacterium sp.]MBI5926855.1 porin [Aquabacterium sp.]